MKHLLERFHRHRHQARYIKNLEYKYMLTAARLDAALAANVAKDAEITDLKSQVGTLQGQVANALPADVVAKAEQLVTALAGPEAAPVAPVA